jgi:TM2 domain.
MIWQYGTAVLLTLFLGPGVGHLALKKYKKGIALICIAIGILFAMAAYLTNLIDVNSLPQDFGSMKVFLKSFIADNAGKLKFFNVSFIVLYTYAFSDIVINAISEYKKNAKEKN